MLVLVPCVYPIQSTISTTGGVVIATACVSECSNSVHCVHVIKSQETNIWPTFCFHGNANEREKENTFRHTHCHTSVESMYTLHSNSKTSAVTYIFVLFFFYYNFTRSPDFITFEHDNEKKINEKKSDWKKAGSVVAVVCIHLFRKNITKTRRANVRVPVLCLCLCVCEP